MKVLWGFFALLGAAQRVFGFNVATSSPRQAAAVAGGLAWAIIPYVFARAAPAAVRD